MTQLIANFFYNNSGSINATFTDTLGATGSISESAGYNGANTFYGLGDVEYESIKVYTGSCELQPIVTGSGFVLAGDLYNLFSYSPDGRRFSKKFLSLPTTITKVGPGEYQYSDFSTHSYSLPHGVYGDGTLIMWRDRASGYGPDPLFVITDDLGKTWRYTPTPLKAAQLDETAYEDGLGSWDYPTCGAYGKGVFVVCGYRSGNIYYSEDKGVTWHVAVGSILKSENFNFNKTIIETDLSSQVVFDGIRFVQCAPHYERNRDGDVTYVSMGRYSYDGKVWHNFPSQNVFLENYTDWYGVTKKLCRTAPLQMFVAGNSAYVMTMHLRGVEDDYKIRRIYSSSIANDTSNAEFYENRGIDMIESPITSKTHQQMVGGGTNECVYIGSYTYNQGIVPITDTDYNKNYYLAKFNPSTNTITPFKFWEIDPDDHEHPRCGVVSYNRDNNTFIIGDFSNEDGGPTRIQYPVFNITNETFVEWSKLAAIKYYPDSYVTDTYCYTTMVIPIVSTLTGSLPPPTSSVTPPDNQYFASASLISSLYFTMTGSNSGAATESFDPPMSASATVWFKWTPTVATESALYSIATVGSDFDTVLYLFELSGSESPENLVQLEWNDDFDGFTSVIDSVITGSKTYYICVGGHNGDNGNYILSSSYVNPPPANDTHENAIMLTGNVGLATGSNMYATTETIDGYTYYRNVWWKLQTSYTRTEKINLSGSSFPTQLNIFTISGSTYTYVNGGSDYAQFTATSGSTYYISIGGDDKESAYQGNIRLSYK